MTALTDYYGQTGSSSKNEFVWSSIHTAGNTATQSWCQQPEEKQGWKDSWDSCAGVSNIRFRVESQAKHCSLILKVPDVQTVASISLCTSSILCSQHQSENSITFLIRTYCLWWLNWFHFQIWLSIPRLEHEPIQKWMILCLIINYLPLTTIASYHYVIGTYLFGLLNWFQLQRWVFPNHYSHSKNRYNTNQAQADS